MPHPDDLKKRADSICNTAEGFCKAFAAGESPYKTLDKYFTRGAKILEHGPTISCLPFLGTTFIGRRSDSTSIKTCDDYYDLLVSVVSFHPDENTVPPREQFLVDPEKSAVTIKLHATFASGKTGKSWEENFVYVLSDFDDDGKIGSQELWADPLSAWMAVQES